jgi:TPP-dependent pyruvate/acetoin dehydrogenase alpha subunit
MSIKLLDQNQDSSSRDEHFYREMLRIRFFEEKVLAEFSSGLFLGTTHTYLGQEANAVGVLDNLDTGDIVVSNHRSHGHFLAYGGDMQSLFAELMGKPTGVCAGRGGSQHLHWKNFYSNGVLGGTAPIATGIALAEKIKNTATITVLFLGDGALGEGVVYESLNMASLWSIPILFIVENNQIAQTTPIDVNLAGEIGKRFGSFGIAAEEIETSDVVKINSLTAKILSRMKEQPHPFAMIINIKKHHDPIAIHGPRIKQDKKIAIDQQVADEVAKAFHQALSSQ